MIKTSGVSKYTNHSNVLRHVRYLIENRRFISEKERIEKGKPLTENYIQTHVPSKEAMDKFFEIAGEEVAKSGHILESTEVTMLTN